MTEALRLLAAIFLGGLIAGLFLMLLWHSLQKLPTQARPTRSLLLGMGLRLALSAILFYAILATLGTSALLLSLLGFALTRQLCLKWLLPTAPEARRPGVRP